MRKKNFVLNILLSFLFLFLVTLSFFIEKDLKLLSIFSIISFVLFITLKKYKILSVQFFAILFLYIYNCGQVWLCLFQIPFSKSSFLITQFSNLDIYNALFYFLIFINILEIIINIMSCKENNIEGMKSQNDQVIPGLKTTLLLFSIICFLTLMYNDIRSIKVANVYGYAEAYTIGRANSFVYTMIQLFPLLTFLWMLIGTKRERKIVLIYSVIRALLLMLLVGNRGQYLSQIVCIFLLYHNEFSTNTNNKKNYKQLLSIIVLGFLLVSLSSFVSNTRNIVGGNISIIDNIIDNNIIVNVLQELGGTDIDLIMIIKLCPNTLPFASGKSIISAIFQIIPGANRLIPSFIEYSYIGAILNNYFSKGSGLGGSLVAEFYYNFSWISLLFVPLLATFIYKINSSITRKYNSKLIRAITYYYAYSLFLSIRSGVIDLAISTRCLIYFLIIFYIIKGKSMAVKK